VYSPGNTSFPPPCPPLQPSSPGADYIGHLLFRFDDNELTAETEALLYKIDADVRRRELEDNALTAPAPKMVRQWDLADAAASAMSKERGEL
jgi:hypothetical protein